MQTTGEKDILILVDGVERPIDRLTVEEVESVTVLKDAAAVANIRANVDFEVSPTTRVSANILGILMETNGVPNVNSNDAWWHLYKVPALAFPVRTAGGVWGGSQSYGDFNLQAKSQGSGFMKTHQRQIWANMTLEQDLDIITKGLKFYVGASYDNSSNTIETRSKGYQYG